MNELVDRLPADFCVCLCRQRIVSRVSVPFCWENHLIACVVIIVDDMPPRTEYTFYFKYNKIYNKLISLCMYRRE